MKGAFITNKYYTDPGMEYIYSSMKAAFNSRGVELNRACPNLVYDSRIKTSLNVDFVLFWDKDVYLASGLEKAGLRLFNSASAIAVCDDKQKTYASLEGVKIPKTVSAPLMYDVCNVFDQGFLDMVVGELGFPLIIKENTGSQGRQVFKADSMDELRVLYSNLKHKPHHYQQFTGSYGRDLRVYTVGGRAIASCIRSGTDFKSNLFGGGNMVLCDAGREYTDLAGEISRQLGLDYGAVDFLTDNGDGGPVFLEANSNAYFKGIEGLGADIAGEISSYVSDVMKK